MIKRLATRIIRWSGLIAFGYFTYEWFERAFLGGSGDALIPLGILIFIVIGSAIFEKMCNIFDSQREVLMSTLVFLQQSREEVEYLRSVQQYYHQVDLMDETEQLN